MRKLRLRLPILLSLIALAGAALTPLALGQAGAATTAKTASAKAASAGGTARRTPPAHAAASYLTGIGDESPEMFTDPNAQQLQTRIARYIAP